MRTSSRRGHGRRLALASLPMLLVVVVALGWLASVVDGERHHTADLAATTQRFDALTQAQGLVAGEANELLALRAFRQDVPGGLENQAAAAESMRAAATRPQLLTALTTVDANGAAALATLHRLGVQPPDPVETTLGPLPDARLADVRADRRTLDGAQYARASQWLLQSTQSARADRTAAQDELVALGGRGPAWRDPTFVAVVLGLAATVIATLLVVRGMLVGLVGRAEARGDELERTNERLTSLFDIVRGLGTSRGVDEVGTTVVEQAVATTAADWAVLLMRGPGGLEPRWAHGAVGARARSAPDGLVARTIDRARPGRAVVDAEPTLTSPDGPLTLVAAPLVLRGRVSGVVLAGSRGSELLDVDDEDSLEVLALCAAPALDAARTLHDTAELALVDDLTGLHNKRRLHADLAQAVERATTESIPLAVAMIDVDHFKAYNDAHGHPAGDRALRRVAAVVRACVRDQDRVYRFGGEELAVLLPDTARDEALAVAERIRAGVALDAGDPERITVSVGVAATPPADPARLVDAADTALYRAKAAGRNRVEAASTDEGGHADDPARTA